MKPWGFSPRLFFFAVPQLFIDAFCHDCDRQVWGNLQQGAYIKTSFLHNFRHFMGYQCGFWLASLCEKIHKDLGKRTFQYTTGCFLSRPLRGIQPWPYAVGIILASLRGWNAAVKAMGSHANSMNAIRRVGAVGNHQSLVNLRDEAIRE